MEKAIEDANDGDLIVFPETALILSEKDNKPFMNLVRSKSFEKNITLITGIIEREDDYRIRNRLQTLGAMEDVYDLSLIHI